MSEGYANNSIREVAVVTDSTSDMPRQWVEELGISVVPLTIVMDGVSHPDGTFSQEEYFARMAGSSKLPTTSQPSVGAFVEAYEHALSAAKNVISVNISSKLSGTIQSATEAAKEFGDRVHVFDSLSLSGGLGLVTRAAAMAANAGASAREVLAKAEEARDRVRVIVGLDSIENLAKGGRIGKVASLMGGMLNIRPLLEVKDGAFEPVAKARGAKAQLRAFRDRVAEEVGDRKGGTFIVLHAMARERAEELRDEFASLYSPDEIIIQEAGTVISTHTGTGIGTAFIPG